MTSKGSRANPTKRKDLFVGRQTELALVRRLLEEARGGRGSFVAISGEPGIGKTTLAEAIAAAASGKGFDVFWGQCHDGQYVPPYWPWKQLLRDLLPLLPRQGRKSPNNKIATALSEIVTGLGQGPAVPKTMAKPISDQTRLRIFESATSLIRIVSDRKPLLLIIDNLHCADVPSLQLLELVAREMSARSVVILGSYREPAAEAGSPFRETIGALAGQEFFKSIPLSGWDQDGVLEYLKAWGQTAPPASLVQAVLGRTEGNPLFVAEVVRLLEHKGLLEGVSAENVQAWEAYIPQKVRLAILGLFQRLSAPCREAMVAAALMGREFEAAPLREIVHQDNLTIEQLLEEAIAHAMIEEDPGKPGSYTFAHALIQDVISEQTPAPRRAALHLKIGETLERLYHRDLEAHAGELARHFDAAGSEEAERAIRYHRLAGERALRMCAFEDAFEQIRRALELGAGKGLPHDTARLVFVLAQSQHGRGTFKEAVENHKKAFDLFLQAGELENAVYVLEQPYILTEKGMGTTSVLERAISLLGEGSLEADGLGSKYGLALYHDTGDYQRAAGVFQRALESARKTGNRLRESTVLINWSRVEHDELHFQDSFRMAEEGCRLSRGDYEFWLEWMSRNSCALALLGLGRLAEAEQQSVLLSAAVERVPGRVWSTVSRWTDFAVRRQKGQLSAARDVGEKALAISRSSASAWSTADMALLSYELGETREGAAFLRTAIEDVPSAVLPFHWEGSIAMLIPYIAWLTGEQVPLDVAEATSRTVLAGAVRRGEAVNVDVGLGLIDVMRGNRESASRHYQSLLPFKGLILCPYQGIAADHLLALLASASGDPAGARSHFDAALAFCRANGLVLELAYTCRDYAQVLLSNGARPDGQAAAGLCAEAVPLARGAGLPFLTRRLEELQSLAGEGRTESTGFPDQLSHREVEVLRLLAEGLSNGQIGERLFISLHTVANHVQKILEKTGAANRTEAAMYAVRHNLTGRPARE